MCIRCVGFSYFTVISVDVWIASARVLFMRPYQRASLNFIIPMYSCANGVVKGGLMGCTVPHPMPRVDSREMHGSLCSGLVAPPQ